MTSVAVSESSTRFGGFWLRAVALLIDTILSTIISVIIAGIFGAVLGFQMAQSGADLDSIQIVGSVLGQFIGAVVGWIYFASMESSSWQATLGKRAVGIRVIDEDGNRISFGRASGRYFAKILSTLILCVGFFMAGWTRKKQGLHDIIAGTLVVKS